MKLNKDCVLAGVHGSSETTVSEQLEIFSRAILIRNTFTEKTLSTWSQNIQTNNNIFNNNNPKIIYISNIDRTVCVIIV